MGCLGVACGHAQGLYRNRNIMWCLSSTACVSLLVDLAIPFSNRLAKHFIEAIFSMAARQRLPVSICTRHACPAKMGIYWSLQLPIHEICIMVGKHVRLGLLRHRHPASFTHPSQPELNITSQSHWMHTGITGVKVWIMHTYLIPLAIALLLGASIQQSVEPICLLINRS